MKRSLFLHLLGAAPFATATPFTLPKRRVHARPLPKITLGIWEKDPLALSERRLVTGVLDGRSYSAFAVVPYAHLVWYPCHEARQAARASATRMAITIVQAGLA